GRAGSDRSRTDAGFGGRVSACGMVKRAGAIVKTTSNGGSSGLASVFGHNSAVRALRRGLVANELAGSYLFAGPHGVGKTTLATVFGMAAACLTPNDHPFDACGTCDSCSRALAGAHPEILIISPAGDQTQIWQFWN